MPTPVGHLLAGAIIYQARGERTRNFTLLALLLVYALLPDVDFLFGFVVGDPNRYHHQFTHSFVFAIVAGALGGWIYAKRRQVKAMVVSALFISAGSGHLILDILAADKRAPFGCPLWWPFSTTFVISPVLVFSDVSRASDSGHFFSSLLNAHNLTTVIIEASILTPLLLAVMWLKKQQKSESPKQHA